MRWKKVTLVGVGLLGGSLGLALKRNGSARRVVGYVRREASVAECLRAGAVDSATLDLREAVSGADLIVFCTPIAQMRSLALQMRPWLGKKCVITDVGSVKGNVIKSLERVLERAGVCFVGSHPMAGAEKMGVAHASSELFKGAVCVVTPTANTPSGPLRRIRKLWESVGCRVLELSPREHDTLVSRSSHLPHVVAAQLVNYVLAPSWHESQGSLCATGFRDTTRIASGSPEMWRDIVVANKKALGEALKDFVLGLEDFRQALAAGDEDSLRQFFEKAKSLRDDWASKIRLSSPE